MKFAAIRSVDRNIGEEVQWLAQSRFLPNGGDVKNLNKENLSRFRPKERTRIIVNGWFAYNGGFVNAHWPFHRTGRLIPGKNVEPLVVSFHVTPLLYKNFATKKMRDFFFRHAPVGCRDIETKMFFDSIGVPSYFSACLTLTLRPNPDLQKEDSLIVAAGLTDDEIAKLRSMTDRRVIAMDSTFPMVHSSETRMDLAKAVLAIYQKAKCVVTGRMHVALPCLAFDTPVLVIERDKTCPACLAGRFSGYENMLHYVKHQDFVEGRFSYDVNNPPPNPNNHIPYRDALVEKCKNFTGYDNKETLLTEKDPEGFVLEVFSRAKYFNTARGGELYQVPVKKLFTTGLKRIFFRYGWWDSKIK